jgi:hypothetical protein
MPHLGHIGIGIVSMDVDCDTREKAMGAAPLAGSDGRSILVHPPPTRAIDAPVKTRRDYFGVRLLVPQGNQCLVRQEKMRQIQY